MAEGYKRLDGCNRSLCDTYSEHPGYQFDEAIQSGNSIRILNNEHYVTKLTSMRQMFPNIDPRGRVPDNSNG